MQADIHVTASGKFQPSLEIGIVFSLRQDYPHLTTFPVIVHSSGGPDCAEPSRVSNATE